jgi:tetratricopeptide (TPR) repeat protein
MSRKGRRRSENRDAEFLRRHEVFLLARKGRTQLRRGHLREAEETFRKVLEIDPLNRDALQGSGDLLLRRKDYQGAAGMLEKAAAVHPSGDRLLYSLAGAYRGLRRRDKTLKVLLRLVEANPGHIQGLTRLGDAYLERKDFDRAMRAYEQALELNGDNIYALRGIGTAYRGKRMYGEAIANWETLLRLTPRDHWTMVRLGDAFARRGERSNARRAYRLALEVMPGNRYALQGLENLE